ncbi:MAG: bifunctional riboflavin kinase/FAD synthetase [Bacteroidetes bacterium]|nr:bifunctional riboflavin kinase/FAD synthetase [Bacteroidota bacterium]
MKVYQSIEEFSRIPFAVVTIGTFDGVHAGHQKIISRLVELAKKNHGETVVMTFFPHPRMVLQPDDNSLKMISTMDEKIELLRKSGIDHLIIQPFSKEFSRTGATEFVRDILSNRIGTKILVIGYDHHFGRNREGNYKNLEELAPVYDFRLEEIDEQDVNDVAVSSTKIRAALLAGDIHSANELLGYDFQLKGIVTDGERVGRRLGYPTANIQIPENYKLVPADGIYAVLVKLEDETYKGMLYIGNRPSLNGKKRSIEVNIFDFDRDIYGEFITVFLKERIRGDMNFENLDHLRAKMNEDKENATKILS